MRSAMPRNPPTGGFRPIIRGNNCSWLHSIQPIPPYITLTMFSSARRRCLRAAVVPQCTEVSIPSFLLPAFQPSSQRAAAFSSSSQCHSKIGSAPLSLPPEVTFQIIEPPVQRAGARVSRTQQGATIEIEGPLGKMSMSIPAYMGIKSDEAKRAHTLSILDQENRKQREMWGECRDVGDDGSGCIH